MKIKKGKIIGIVGAPGSGKTTLGRNLKKILEIDFFEEEWKNNPFVFGPKSESAHELEVDLGFLVIRERQHRLAQAILEKGKDVLMDTVFEMTNVYAKAFSDKDEYKIFSEVYKRYSADIEKPGILIYLYGPHDLLAKRARRRHLGIDLEKNTMSIEGVKTADKLIKKYLNSMEGVKIIKVNVEDCDVRDIKCAESILEEINRD